MRRLPIHLPLTLLWLAACSLFSPEAPAVDTRPADFNAQYYWYEGSLPPPYHYEYFIYVDSSGAGVVEMVPDYPSEGVPVWTESFTVDPVALDEFYRQLVTAGAFSVQWREEDQPPVGGSHFVTTLTAHGQTVTIPSFVIASQATAQGEISNAFVALVPQTIWEKLDAQRETYVREYSS